MITRILDLQSPWVGKYFEKNACLEYEEDGEAKALIFFSQKQALPLLKERIRSLSVHDQAEYTNAIMGCGLPVLTESEPQVITGPSAFFLRVVREFQRDNAAFGTNSRQRIQIVSVDLGEQEWAGGVLVVDERAAWHVYIVHSKSQCRDALRVHRSVCSTGVIHQLVQLVNESSLPEWASPESVHIEHDAAERLGTWIDFYWCVQNGKIKLPANAPKALT